jgi:hypothetical protein
MPSTTLSAREFNQDTGRAKKAAALVHGTGVGLVNPWDFSPDP